MPAEKGNMCNRKRHDGLARTGAGAGASVPLKKLQKKDPRDFRVDERARGFFKGQPWGEGKSQMTCNFIVGSRV